MSKCQFPDHHGAAGSSGAALAVIAAAAVILYARALLIALIVVAALVLAALAVLALVRSARSAPYDAAWAGQAGEPPVQAVSSVILHPRAEEVPQASPAELPRPREAFPYVITDAPERARSKP